MAQFDVYRNSDSSSRKRFPLLLDIQADVLDTLDTRVVVPLAELDERSAPPITGLMPVFGIEGGQVVMHTAEMAGIARKALGPKVSSLAGHRHEIVAALDFVISGV